MTKGTSEGKVRLALNQLGYVIYKPPDDARNWKPCDFMVWWIGVFNCDESVNTLASSAWIEVKECTLVGSFPLADLRRPQRTGIRDAASIGLPYLLVIWWPRRRIWTISDGIALKEAPTRGSVAYSILAGKIGIDAQQPHLAETLHAVLEEGLLDGKGPEA